MRKLPIFLVTAALLGLAGCYSSSQLTDPNAQTPAPAAQPSGSISPAEAADARTPGATAPTLPNSSGSSAGIESAPAPAAPAQSAQPVAPAR